MVDSTNNLADNLQKAGNASVNKQAGNGWKEHSLSPKEEVDWMVDRAIAAGVELPGNGHGSSKEELDEWDKLDLKVADYYEELTEAITTRGSDKNWWNLVGAAGGGIGATLGFLKQDENIKAKTDKISKAVTDEVADNALIFLDMESVHRGAKKEEISIIAKKWAEKTNLSDGGVKTEATEWLNDAFDKIRNKKPKNFKLGVDSLSEEAARAVKPFYKRMEKLFPYAVDVNKHDHGAVFDEAVKKRIEDLFPVKESKPLTEVVMGKVKEYYADFATRGGAKVSSVDIKSLIEKETRGITSDIKLRVLGVVGTMVAGVVVSDLFYNMTHASEKKHIDLLKDKVKDINAMVKRHDKPGVEVSLPSEKMSERVVAQKSSHISAKV